MSTQHTHGRLYTLQNYPDTIHQETPGGRGNRICDLSSMPDKAKATQFSRRLVACWNACEGLPTDILEDESIMKIDSRIRRERADLLEALKLADCLLSGANMNREVVEHKVRAAIAKAEGGAA